MSSVVQPQPKFVLMAILLLPLPVLAQNDNSLSRLWTLENSIERVLNIAPEMKAAEAQVSAR